MKFARHNVDLSSPKIMGILNVTPDSFFDGGNHFSQDHLDLDSVLYAAEAMVADGADFIDVGGESTRPGAEKVSVDQELQRVIPVLEALSSRVDAVLSVDTSAPEVMKEAFGVGAGLINDVRALQRDGALQTASETTLPVCIMHMQGEPASMQNSPRYDDVVSDLYEFFKQRLEAAANAGIDKDKIILDPGFGFGKTDAQNLEIVRRLGEFLNIGCPLLLGVSRKSTIGRKLGRELHERLPGSLALAQICAQKGAAILRVHDVAETRDVLKINELVQ